MRETLSAEEKDALNEIALQRIAEEAEQRTGILDLRDLGLTSLPPQLAELTHLEDLNIGSEFLPKKEANHIADLALLSGLVKLRWLDFKCQQVSSIQPLSGLLELEFIKMDASSVRDLTPLSALGKLREIRC